MSKISDPGILNCSLGQENEKWFSVLQVNHFAMSGVMFLQRDSGVFACVSELRGQGNVGFDIFCNCSMLTYARYSSGMQWSINSDENLVSKRSRQHVKLQALWVYFQFLVIMSRIKIALPTFCPPRRNPKQRYVTRFSITSGSEVETMTHPLGSFWQWRIAKSDT